MEAGEKKSAKILRVEPQMGAVSIVMKDFEIRPARSDDAEAIADLHFDSRRVAMPWLPVLHSREDTIAYFAGHVLLLEETLVAEVNQLVVGFIALEGDHVDHLYIAPAYQGRGIGDKLLALAKELRPDGLTLWTFQRNAPARRFYEARGFVASEFTDGSRNEERVPDVLYTWLPSASSGSA
jgi:ribosomal protein S18 acetylase RimI-like enzyme